MDITFTLSDIEHRALLATVARENAENSTKLTLDQFVQARIKDQLSLLVRKYKERVANEFFARFEKADLATQQRVIGVLNSELSDDGAPRR
jgi:hypothetical protein